MAPTPDKRPAEGLRLAVYGFDRDEASQIRRIKGLQALGCQVTGFANAATPWPQIARRIGTM